MWLDSVIQSNQAHEAENYAWVALVRPTNRQKVVMAFSYVFSLPLNDENDCDDDNDDDEEEHIERSTSIDFPYQVTTKPDKNNNDDDDDEAKEERIP